jgi:hypothetical protein
VSHAVNKASLEMCDKCLYAQSMLEKKDKRWAWRSTGTT